MSRRALLSRWPTVWLHEIKLERHIAVRLGQRLYLPFRRRNDDVLRCRPSTICQVYFDQEAGSFDLQLDVLHGRIITWTESHCNKVMRMSPISADSPQSSP